MRSFCIILPRMDELSLRIFLTLARKRSFSKAAEYHYLTQPAISRRIKQLEEHAGTKLFERGKGQRILLTRAGRAFLEHAERILSLYDKLYEDLSQHSMVAEGKFIFGASTTLGEYVLPKVISAYRRSNPHVEMFLKVESTKKIKELLLQRSLCMGLLEEVVEEEEFECKKFLESELLLIVPNGHRIFSDDKVRFSQVLKDPWILREEGSGTRKIIEETLQSKGLKLSSLNIKIELDSTEAVKNAVREGLGISLISELSLLKDSEGLSQKRFEDINFKGKFYLCYDRYNKRAKACKEFSQFLLSLDFERILKG
jgi:DNA-binding transcriptional LysR family regulator